MNLINLTLSKCFFEVSHKIMMGQEQYSATPKIWVWQNFTVWPSREWWFFRWKIDFLFCVKSFVQDCRLQIGALTSSLKSNKRSVTKMPLSRHFDLLFLKKKFYENVWISLSTSAGRKEPLFYEASPSGGFLNELDIDLFLKYIWACNKRPLSWNFELLL